MRGGCPIGSGHDCFLNGKPAACIGDSINCGSVITSGSGNVIIGDTPSSFSGSGLC